MPLSEKIGPIGKLMYLHCTRYGTYSVRSVIGRLVQVGEVEEVVVINTVGDGRCSSASGGSHVRRPSVADCCRYLHLDGGQTVD